MVKRMAATTAKKFMISSTSKNKNFNEKNKNFRTEDTLSSNPFPLLIKAVDAEMNPIGPAAKKIINAKSMKKGLKKCGWCSILVLNSQMVNRTRQGHMIPMIIRTMSRRSLFFMGLPLGRFCNFRYLFLSGS
jgi:hypothetical protein